jgi:hypothetical protein
MTFKETQTGVEHGQIPKQHQGNPKRHIDGFGVQEAPYDAGSFPITAPLPGMAGNSPPRLPVR